MRDPIPEVSLRSGSSLAKALEIADFQEVFMTAIFLIIVFIGVMIGLNCYEFGRPD